MLPHVAISMHVVIPASSPIKHNSVLDYTLEPAQVQHYPGCASMLTEYISL